MHRYKVQNDSAVGLTCRFVLLQRLSGSGLHDELALLVHLQLLHLHGLLSVCRWCSSSSVPASSAASLRRCVSHMAHLNTEGKLMT